MIEKAWCSANRSQQEPENRVESYHIFDSTFSLTQQPAIKPYILEGSITSQQCNLMIHLLVHRPSNHSSQVRITIIDKTESCLKVPGIVTTHFLIWKENCQNLIKCFIIKHIISLNYYNCCLRDTANVAVHRLRNLDNILKVIKLCYYDSSQYAPSSLIT